MRVLHTYCLNYNIGDYALGTGVKNLLRDAMSIDYIGETNIQGREFNKYYIEEVVNKRYDLLIIGGGGIIHGEHWPNGWFWLIDKDLIKTIKIPFIVYGVGNNYFQDELIPNKAVQHLEETYRQSAYFSVRNDESYERVTNQLQIKPREVPDPGFHVGLNVEHQRPISEAYVIVQLANDKSGQRFSGDKQAFVNNLRIVVEKIAKTKKVIFAPHVFDDVALSKDVSQGIDNAEVLDFGSYAFDHTDKMLAFYKYADFVLAMRGHGQIVPIGFGVPTIAMQNHPKHGGLMRKLGLEKYVVDVNDLDFLSKLDYTVNDLQLNRQKIIEKYKQINTELIKQSRLAMEEIKERIA